MANGELSRPLPPRLYADPRHARRPRLRLAMGHADEGHRSDGLDDRAPLRDRLRKARAEQAALKADHRAFRAAEAQRAAAEFVLDIFRYRPPRERISSYPLPLWERVARIARCQPGEGFRS